MHLRAFAQRVLACVGDDTQGLFGEDRVFIAAAYEAMVAKGEAEGLSLPRFKARLLRAYDRGHVMLSECLDTESVDPALLRASRVYDDGDPLHLLRRAPGGNMKTTLTEILLGLSKGGLDSVMQFARTVRMDESRRDGKPRLVTLSPDAFAARVQEIVNRSAADMRVQDVYERLDDAGETTGMTNAHFEAWIRAAHRAGRLTLLDEGPFAAKVLQTNPGPIPWGPPPPILGPGRVAWERAS